MVRASEPTKGSFRTRNFAAQFGVATATISLVIASCFAIFPVAGATSNAGPGDWTTATSPSPAGNWYAVDYANGQWIALGHTPDVAVSRNGSTWTEYQVPAGSWQTVAYGNGEYVALSSVATSPEEMVSTNGVDWTAVPGPSG